MSTQSDMFADELPPAPKAVEPPTDDVKKRLFQFGPGVLVAAGVQEAQARKVIGGWLKRGYPAEAVLSALREAKATSAVDPIGYAHKLMKASKDSGGGFAALREELGNAS